VLDFFCDSCIRKGVYIYVFVIMYNKNEFLENSEYDDLVK